MGQWRTTGGEVTGGVEKQSKVNKLLIPGEHLEKKTSRKAHASGRRRRRQKSGLTEAARRRFN